MLQRAFHAATRISVKPANINCGPTVFRAQMSNSTKSALSSIFIDEQTKLTSADMRFAQKTRHYHPGQRDLTTRLQQQPMIYRLNHLDADNKFGQLYVFTKKPLTIKYGQQGINPDSKTTAAQIANKNSLHIQENTKTLITVPMHTPLMVESQEPLEDTVIHSVQEMQPFLDLDVMMAQQFVYEVMPLDEDMAQRTIATITNKVWGSNKRQPFFEEQTLVLDHASEITMSSGTYMLFSSDANNRTPDHYHTGERRLHIFTNGKPAKAILNFCGPKQNPNTSKSTEKVLEFPQHSHIILKFGRFVPHRFEGDFACFSEHPEETPELFQKLVRQKKETGFIESNTSFFER